MVIVQCGILIQVMILMLSRMNNARILLISLQVHGPLQIKWLGEATIILSVTTTNWDTLEYFL